MKKLILITILVGLIAAPALAYPSLDFSTTTGTSWTLTGTDASNIENWVLSFTADSMIVNNTSTVGDPVLNDILNLPPMAITIMSDDGSKIMAMLNPGSGKLTLKADVASGTTAAGTTVMNASIASGGLATFTSTYIAYDGEADDLDAVGSVPSYSTLIDIFVTGDAGGMALDLNFTGQGSGMYAFMSQDIPLDTTVTKLGTISGSITLIPAPGAILLGSIGVGLVGWLRRRRTL